MRIQPMGSPAAANSSQQSNNTQQDARARAIAMIQGQQPQANNSNHPASLNQNRLTPEMMSAVTSRSSQPQEETPQEEVVAEQPQEEVSKPNTPAPSSQLAMLARREKALRLKQQQQEQSYKAKEDALKLKEEALLAKERQYSPDTYIPRDLIKQQTLKVLADAGVTYDELTQQVLNQSQTNPYTEAQIAKLEAQIAKLTQENEDSRKASSTQQEQAMQAAIKQIEMDVRSLVKTDPAYETVRATNSVKDVVELIKRTYDEDGYVMSVEEATQEVEDYLIEEALKLTKIEKIQRRLQSAPTSNAPIVRQSPQPIKQSQPTKTLTNAIASSRPLSAKERAIAAFKGEKF